ncbi:hypothetical protein [Pedobacter sandarakinus]|uniref:hypothetical protein n=1 Tax=Pedobacter sandarakinus TaxID=353156 RepID=UPI00224567EA|nr:hypothetical protein [Pedobacter sandarakinus]MCX2575368.1 hypothetical protein [Pedobacter sandarakinus]
MEPNIEQLRKNYERFDDRKLIRIATEEATSLRPEALELVKEIIKERNLSEDILKGVEVQFQEVDKETLNEYTELLRNLPCPVCKSNSEKLNATITGSVVSFIIITNYEKGIKIACPKCLDKLHNNAMIKTALFGWWGIPWGIIRTSQALILNSKMKSKNHSSGPTKILSGFVSKRIGRIEANRNKKEELESLIEHIR